MAIERTTALVPRAADLRPEHLGMSAEDLVAATPYPLRVLPTVDDLYAWLARTMAAELKQRNARALPTRWILPVGPKAHYPMLAEITNRERLSWRDVWAFHMDEWLDWQGRPLSPSHPFSFRGFMQRNLYDRIDPDLRPPAEQIVYPSVYAIDDFSERLRDVGGADTAFVGFGYRGHLAFNEPPASRWHSISVDEFAASKTRVVKLLDDTIVAHSHRTTGGYTEAIPPMAVTIGMADILAARTIHLVTDGGAWKQYITRVFLLTTEREVDLPVTLCHGHPDVRVTVDVASAAPIVLGLEP